MRTELQHLWAELSEKLADKIDPAIKYGGGSEQLQELLERSSRSAAEIEEQERRMFGFLGELEPRLDAIENMPADVRSRLDDAQMHIEASRAELMSKLKTIIAWAQNEGIRDNLKNDLPH